MIGPDGTYFAAVPSLDEILHVSAAGDVLATITAGLHSSPNDLAFGPDGLLYVTTDADGVLRYNPDGTFRDTFVPTGTVGLEKASGLAWGPDGDLYIVNQLPATARASVLIRVGVTGEAVSGITGLGVMIRPEDVTFGPDGLAYVSDDLQPDQSGGTTRITFALGTFMSRPPRRAASSRSACASTRRATSWVVNKSNNLRRRVRPDGASLPPDRSSALGSSMQFLTVAPSASIRGNRIGTTADGQSALPNFTDGIRLDAHDATVGGAASGAGNLISGNTVAGIGVFGTGDAATLIEGNDIGTNAGATSALPNNYGILVQDSDSNTIGGTGAGEGNVLSSNAAVEILIQSSNHDVVQRNVIGTNGAPATAS